MGRIVVTGVAVLLFGVAQLWMADFDDVRIPFLLPADAAPAVPASIRTLGTPAAGTPGEVDPSWFAPAEGADPLDPDRWAALAAFAAEAKGPGWPAACAKTSSVAGADRTANPGLGALACSGDASLAGTQRFALQILAAQAEVALWMRAVPGHSSSGVSARLGEIRFLCTAEHVAREGGPGSVYGRACTTALANPSLAAGGQALFAALDTAYREVAAEIARRDPSIEPEAGAPAATPSPTPGGA